MTEAEWLACKDSHKMMPHLDPQCYDRKLRLFACACCRRIPQLTADGAARNVVDMSENYADGIATYDDLRTTVTAWMATWKNKSNLDWRLYTSIESAAACGTASFVASAQSYGKAAQYAAQAIAATSEFAELPVAFAMLPIEDQGEAARQLQAALLRDIIGNPFRSSPPLPPAVLAWNDRTVPRLAEVIYEDRQLPAGTLEPARLGILADALLDAGCDDEGLLAHCRSAGPHVRGCWAVDLILGKN
jgi:hypothetical protein